ncbi:threonine ammonia-lyase [Heterostelium album PN500]|uniref:Threonine ammonia-lyase n=1 Tax=Heterostelium pallidum (strain ATCC 26659 / Pp 5 / PN500) TaxID=670386 RepID=D3B801_HETP5|nr:threonine ammonia-lyase [Heterostelium album PN500]EFA82169.1 threonine ammonia-lyase [Heterostelium album PN500]|eukprot:XP_020434286.1 threonine ammonia-lyase [Heterostelium album PN500]
MSKDEMIPEPSSVNNNTNTTASISTPVKKSKVNNNNNNNSNGSNGSNGSHPTPTSTSTTTTTTSTTSSSSSDTMQVDDPTGVNSPLDTLRGFEEIGEGVIRRNTDGQVDFLATVNRMTKYTHQFIKHTPQYHYELLSQILKCDVQLKLENLQLFGDLYVRNCLSILLSNYFNEANKLGCEYREIGGFVVVMDPKCPENQTQLSGTVLTALHLKNKFIIYVAPGELSLLQVVQGDISTCYERARKHASDLHMVYIDLKFSLHYSMIGAATLAEEIMEKSEDRETIVIPLRLYTVGWSYVSGLSLYLKMIKPQMKVIVCQMTEDLYGMDGEGKEFNRQSLFPDRIEIGWLALIHDKSDLTNVFDAFDARDQGKFTPDDVITMLVSMGGDASRNPCRPSKSSFSQTEFVNEVITQTLSGMNTKEKISQQFLKQFSLENLKEKKLVDQVVPVTEDQAAIAFIKCLEYTHTMTNGKGSIALGGMFSGNIKLKQNEKIVVLLSGGFVDVIDFQTILNYGLDLAGQTFEVELDLPDNTNALSKVLNVIGSNNVSVHEINMDRSCESLKQYHVRVLIQCNSRNFQQQQSCLEVLDAQGFKNLKKIAAPNRELTILSPTMPQTIISPNDSKAPMILGSPNGATQQQSSSPGISIPPSIPSVNTPPLKRSITDISIESIREAQQRIKHIMSPTPIYHSTTYSKLCGCQVTLMLENIQKTGSFKIRGSSNMVLRAIEQSSYKPVGLVAASAGNHAQGVALISAKVGLPCTIVCPEYAPDSKLSHTKQYGAEVIKKGKSLEDAVNTAEMICKERNWTLVRPYNDVDVIEGQGTMGCDIYDKVPDVDTVIVNVGGGGMIAGIALFLKKINPNIRIIGVQSQNVSPLADFKQTNQLRYIEPAVLSLADGTNVKMPGGVHTQVLHDLVDEYVTVSENEIASTIVHLMYNSRTVSEGAGCLGLAALIHHKIKVRKDERVVVIICGGNIDMSTLRQVYEYGLRSLGRSFTIHLTTWDYPGNLHKIISLAARAELKVSEIRHIRGTGDINWNEVTISLSFYSNSFHHQNFFLSLLVDVGLFPTVIGRRYIKDHELVYQIYDKSVIAKENQLKETFSERQKAFLEMYGKQANTSTLM